MVDVFFVVNGSFLLDEIWAFSAEFFATTDRYKFVEGSESRRGGGRAGKVGLQAFDGCALFIAQEVT